tara:strand:- start:38805 stop:39455 length:651 start_codon:yes stop_codon:yes gene_type:complete
MTETVENPNIHPSRTPSSDHNDHTANIFDKINTRLNSIKKEKQKQKTFNKDHFFGYVLYSTPLTTTEFSEKFPPETSFHKEVLLGGEDGDLKTKIKESASVVECRVHIPEITGFLPLPNLDLIFSALKLPKTTVTLYEKEYKKRLEEFKKEYPEARRKAFKEIMKLNLYPKFYMYSENAKVATMGQFCKVKFSKSLPQETKGVGIFLEGLDSFLNE